MKKILVMMLSLMLMASSAFASEEGEIYKRDITYENESEINLEIDFGMGELSVARARGDFIARIHGKYDEDVFKVDVTYDKKGDKGFLKIKVENKKKFMNFKTKESHNEWDILLGDMVPLNIELDAGMAAADFDFTGLNITGLNMDVGMASGVIMFNKPNPGHIEKLTIDAGQSSLQCLGFGNANFDRLIVDAGMASLEMDFSGAMNFDAKVDMDVGMGSADITLNSKAGTRIRAEEDWTSSIDMPRSLNKVRKGLYESDNYDSAEGHLDFDIDVGMGSIDFGFAKSL